MGKVSRRRLLFSFLAIAAIATCFVVLDLVAYFSNIILPWHRASAIKATLAFGDLAPFPQSATDFTIRTAGSAFTREFIVTFHAPVGDIREWVRACPSLVRGTPEVIGARTHRYYVAGGGASGGYVTIDYDEGYVHICVMELNGIAVSTLKNEPFPDTYLGLLIE